jgi:hypothetical protein
VLTLELPVFSVLRATLNMPIKSFFLAVLTAIVLASCGGDSSTLSSSSPAPQSKALSGAVVVSNTASFSGNRSNYTITKTSTGYTVVDNVGSDGTSTLGSNVTLLRFADTYLSMDTDGIPGQVYRLYQAAFNRTPDTPGLGWWITYMNAGLSLTDVSGYFEGSDEFRTLYGSSVTNENLVTLLYQNVLHRTPDQAGYNLWVNTLNSGQLSRQQVLYYFSESAENKSQVLSAIQNGIAYSPYHLTPAPTLQLAARMSGGAAINSDGTLWTWSGDVGPQLVGPGYSVVALGGSHTLALKSDGSLWAWGNDSQGQLGDGNTADYFFPVWTVYSPERIDSGYSAIAAGGSHSLGLKTDGTLWAWGSSSNGQLGDGGTFTHATPKQIGSGFSAIAAGSLHSVALKNNGTLWAWGSNQYGQLGDGTNIERHTPVLIGSGFVSVSTKDNYTLAIKSDGTLWAWGLNSSGQLGDGTNINRSAPVQIGTGFVSASAGYDHSMAVKADGTVWGWGNGMNGQINPGTGITPSAPVQISTAFTSVSAGFDYSIGIKSDGSLWAWGAGASDSLVSATLSLMQSTQFWLYSPYAGNWSGGYSGIADSGLCSMAISNMGSISGSCSGGRVGLLSISGSVDNRGDASFSLTGASISSSSFSGQFVSTSLVNGYWSIPSTGASGTWSLSKQ